jgi:hypothetical protein
MRDIVYISLCVLLFGVSFGLLALCRRLMEG